jgi:predicted HTH domain antitoxin
MKNLTVRIDEETYEEIELTASRENVDKSTVARRLLKTGIQEARKKRSLEMYREGRWSLWKAASMAGIPLREMMDLLAENRIPLNITPEDVDEAWREAIEK